MSKLEYMATAILAGIAAKVGSGIGGEAGGTQFINGSLCDGSLNHAKVAVDMAEELLAELEARDHGAR